MIYDFNRKIPAQILKPTICIIGSGAIGLSLAKEFEAETGIGVLILEAGGEHARSATELETPLNSGDVSSCVSGAFNQGFGGSTSIWGGQILPFSKMDFEHRPWVEKSHWTLDKSELTEFYDRASTNLNVDYTPFSISALSNPDDNASQGSLDYGFSKWCPEPKLNIVLGSFITQSYSVNLIVNACVNQIHTRNQAISHISIVNLAGDHQIIYPRFTIIAAGGVESVRILLRSVGVSEPFGASQLPGLGRYYQDHIGFYGARLRPLNMASFRSLFSTKLVRGEKVQPKVFLSQKVQLSQKLLNVVANIGIEEKSLSVISLLKKIYSQRGVRAKLGLVKRNTVQILINLPGVIAAVYSLLIRKQVHIPKQADFFLIANCESPPLSSSKITLSHEIDKYGFQKASIHWVLDDKSRESMRHYYVAAKKEIETLGIAQLDIKPSLFSKTDEWKKDCYALFHHMGATRMGESPTDSVVDNNCKVHSVENLYVAGTSVLPTSSASNPTFTAIALAIRLADHLKDKLAK